MRTCWQKNSRNWPFVRGKRSPPASRLPPSGVHRQLGEGSPGQYLDLDYRIAAAEHTGHEKRAAAMDTLVWQNVWGEFGDILAVTGD